MPGYEFVKNSIKNTGLSANFNKKPIS